MEYNILFIPILVFSIGCILTSLFYKLKLFMEVSIGRKLILILVLSFILSAIFYLLGMFIFSKTKYDLLLIGLLPPILFLALAIICLSTLVSIINIFEKSKLQEDNINDSNKKIDHKDSIIAKLRSQKHDYLKHLQVVYSLLNSDLTVDAKNYITNIANSFRSKTSRYGKVSYIDAICALKYEECLLKGIDFDTYVQDFIDNLVIEPNEMSSVLLNILDNSIEAVSSTSKDNKYIKLSIHEDELQYVISIINNGPMIYDTHRIFLEGYSSKDGENRGYGLYSIKNILDKYNYHIFADSDDYLTEFTILIPKF